MALEPASPRDQRTQSDPALGRLALSKREAAAALGVSVDFLEEHVMHELRIVRRGRRRLIPVRELELWLDSNAARALASERRDRGESRSTRFRRS
ncbi:MAG: hypothetical protein ACJ762_07455 [Solirubrobacteraceae bacterium]